MFTYQQRQNWGRLALSLPQTKNKLSLALIKALSVKLEELAKNPPARLCIESVSESIFAAGADINEVLALTGASAQDYAAQGQALMDQIESFPTPVFALVSGPCFGGAVDLVLSCRHIWVTENSLFCHPGAQRGLITGFGGTVRAMRRLDPMLAHLILMTGYRFSGLEAFGWGLAEKVFPNKQALLQRLASF